MFLTRISVAHPVFATMVMLAITIFGAVSYTRLPIEREPDVDFPVVAVSVPYAGASPEAVEEDILRPIEDAVSTIGGIDDIEATAIQGRGSVVMFFDLGVDSSDAAQEVRDRLATVEAGFPDGAGDATVRRFDPSARPILSIAVSSDTMPVGDLTALAEDVVARRLLAIDGVGSASVVGGATRRIDVLLDPDRMNAFGVGVGEVTAAIARDNQDLPAGEVRSDRDIQALTVEGRIDEARDFLDVTVADGEGLPVRLGDVATIREAEAEETSLALLDGRRSLSVDVIQQQGANTVAVAEGVRAALADLTENLPEGVALRIVRDNAVEIEDSFQSVQTMLIEGAALATVIVFLFLNSWRSTIITGLTLPISVIGTMTALWALGFTLNSMTLLALSLAVGLLIDDAIVVRENIMRHLHMGKSHRQAALEGTNEIGLAVLATTLSIVAVFLPVAFMEGIIGRFFLQFGITVSIAVLISLFVAFTLDPMMSSVWYDPSADPRAPKGPVWRLLDRFDRGFEALGRGYRSALRLCLRHRYATLLLAAGAFAGSFALVPLVGVEFAPSIDDGEVRVRIETPVGSSLDYTAGKARQVEEIVLAFPEVAQTYTTVASGGRNTAGNQATITATLVADEDRDRTPQDLTTPIREALAVVPGVEATIGASRGYGGGASPISVTLSGDSSAVLGPLADDLVARLGRVPGVVDAATSLADTQPTLAVRLDADAADDLGVSLATVGDTLSALIGGQGVGEWTSAEGRSYELNVQLPSELRRDVASLGSLPVSTADGTLVRLDQVAAVVPSVGASEITRSNLARNVTVSADIQGRTLGEVRVGVDAAIASLDMPVGYTASQGGEAEQLAESGASALTALVLAVVFIYLVLASQFGSFLQPIAIMMSLPLSLVGVLAGLIVGGSTLNIYSIIGFIMLMGLVVKNAILLVDNANQRVREGTNLYDALVEAGETRFRPIVMTTLAMIFGMLPLAINLHGGSAENAPMAHAVIGGLISSTLLTLVVVPVILTFTDAWGRRAARWFPAPPDHAEAAPAWDRPTLVRPAAE